MSFFFSMSFSLRACPRIIVAAFLRVYPHFTAVEGLLKCLFARDPSFWQYPPRFLAHLMRSSKWPGFKISSKLAVGLPVILLVSITTLANNRICWDTSTAFWFPLFSMRAEPKFKIVLSCCATILMLSNAIIEITFLDSCSLHPSGNLFDDSINLPSYCILFDATLLPPTPS